MDELGRVALRAAAMYLYLLVLVRIAGKRTVGNFTAFDLLASLMIGDVIDEVVYGDQPLSRGFVAVGVLVAMHFVNAFLSSRSAALDRLTGGAPTVLVRHGRVDRAALQKEMMHENDLMSLLRIADVQAIDDVVQAILEPSGQLSVQRVAAARPAEKRDVRSPQ